jgi:hydroxymethylpyrimidine/phosphomethylpyrimidine kinase
LLTRAGIFSVKKILTIAGSDCSGGAGIQADIKTICAHKQYAMSVITAVTAQNTLGVQAVFPVPPAIVAAQIESVFSDIVPDAVKIGMVCSAETASVIADELEKYKPVHVVLDPVLASTTGTSFLPAEAVSIMAERLFPLSELITPNIPEFEILKKYARLNTGRILIKGGHSENTADDILYADGIISEIFRGNRINNKNTHGTGCTLSSAIACNLAEGYTVSESICRAKEYITGAINAQMKIGHGRGPLNHFWHNQ